MRSVVIDGFGGDSPDEVIAGAVCAAKKHSDVEIIVTGAKSYVEDKVANLNAPSNLKIVDAPNIVTNDDSPTQAIRQKPDSSLAVALSIALEQECMGVISTGSTGALLTGAILKVGRIAGVRRPTLAAIMPTLVKNQPICIVDTGANVDSKPEFLQQFAIMGSEYYRLMCGVESPIVGLLSVGTESKKGNELTKAAYPLLSETDINFAGNFEARDALSGQYHVAVCDGFAGNVLLKSTEGTAKMVLSMLKTAVKSSTSAKLGYLFMKKAFSELKSAMDYHAYGGAPFLGVKKIVVKSHGASNATSIEMSVNQVIATYEKKLTEAIEKRISMCASHE